MTERIKSWLRKYYALLIIMAILAAIITVLRIAPTECESLGKRLDDALIEWESGDDEAGWKTLELASMFDEKGCEERP